ncbi:hypothetical protein PTSG_03574 [Salpingoeca rosetta]|uniref:MaoC-like domain-containing protein n=1 Tax=Salpingoeca rosetta (strain ATCC 50818 / BSB-021) TaxID=946362 RepID=F2U600_SALR5|nr:uncharacterized protein PTSG_03574 [Salpingoeca rosetta]EGD82941.1 hypothetical protein PTSG_03574 [Salpingoeca rosetta]|eukprot:XP_004995305.1 hypothetical protein PTSG_03574 [Salpingoeca rosetta]
MTAATMNGGDGAEEVVNRSSLGKGKQPARRRSAPGMTQEAVHNGTMLLNFLRLALASFFLVPVALYFHLWLLAGVLAFFVFTPQLVGKAWTHVAYRSPPSNVEVLFHGFISSITKRPSLKAKRPQITYASRIRVDERDFARVCELTGFKDATLAKPGMAALPYMHVSSRKPKAPKERAEIAGEQTNTWTLPHNIGWQYARCSGDYNPIHIHPLTAKLFGQPTCIAHGMYTLARAVAGVTTATTSSSSSSSSSSSGSGLDLRYPIQAANEWKLPLRIPSKAALKFHVADTSAEHVRGIRPRTARGDPTKTGKFASFLVEFGDGKPHNAGAIWAGDSTFL